MGPFVRADAPPAYLSGDWIEAARRRVEQDPGIVKKHLGEADLSLLLVVQDRPGLDGEAVFMEFLRGRLVRVLWGPRDDFETRFASCDFVVAAAYDTFARIHQGVLTERAALLTGKLRVKGGMSKALAMLKAALELNKVLRRVPARYD